MRRVAGNHLSNTPGAHKTKKPSGMTPDGFFVDPTPNLYYEKSISRKHSTILTESEGKWFSRRARIFN